MLNPKMTLENNKNNDIPLFNGEHSNSTPINSVSEEKIQKPKPPTLNIKPPKNNALRKKVKEQPETKTDSSITIGSFLQEARVKSDYSLSQVAMITKLNIHYLEAIERNDFDNAPPYIYVKAYIKKLSELYGVDENNSLCLLKPFGEKGKVVSESILQELEESKQINEKEEKKIVFIIKTAIFALIVALIIAAIIFFFFGGSKTEKENIKTNPIIGKQQIQKKMEKLVVPQTLTPSELEIPENK